MRLADNLITSRTFQERAVVETNPAVLGGVKSCLPDQFVDLQETVEIAERILIQTDVEAVFSRICTQQSSGGDRWSYRLRQCATGSIC